LTYRYDQQNGMEGMLFMLSAVASDADILAGIGSCYNAVGMSAEMMIVQEEWLKAAQFLRRGLNTDLLAKGLESIRNVGPEGNFLMDDLTTDILNSPPEPSFFWTLGHERGEPPTSTVSHFPVGVCAPMLVSFRHSCV